MQGRLSTVGSSAVPRSALQKRTAQSRVCDGRPLVPQLSCSGMRKPGRASNWAQCCCSTAEDTQDSTLSTVISSTGADELEDADPQWANWLLSMKQAYQLGMYQEHIVEQLDQAVCREDFQAASNFKDIARSLENDDVVNKLKQDLSAAIEGERFSDAAELRDKSHSSLEGWWVARGKDDPCGQLVHITSEYSRYVGVAYSTKEIAEAHGWTDEDNDSPQEQPNVRMQELGRTALELYLRETTQKNIEHQACVLKARIPEFSSENPEMTLNFPDIKPNVRLEKNESEDGLALEVNVKLDGRAFRNLRLKHLKQEGGDRQNEEQARNPDWNLSDELDASSSVLFDWTTDSSPAGNNTSSSASNDASPDSLRKPTEIYEEIDLPDADLYRVKAGLHWLDRNHFYLKIDEDKGPQKSVPEPWGRSQTHEDSVPEMTALELSHSRKESLEAAIAVTENKLTDLLQEAVDQALGSRSLEGALDNFVVEGQQEVMDALAGIMANGEGSEISSRIAETLMEKLRRDCGFEDEVTFTRIPTNIPKTDPFSGLYLGSFGPHGPELLLVRRVPQADGSDIVEGMKLTGDPHVPAGEVSFRVKVGRKHRLDSREKYPEQLGILARYPGEGQVADVGHSDPRWVSGECLQFRQSGGSMLTGGAELGFVWAVPGARRFLILLQRLNLEI